MALDRRALLETVLREITKILIDQPGAVAPPEGRFQGTQQVALGESREAVDPTWAKWITLLQY